jgi:hypothetical protein
MFIIFAISHFSSFIAVQKQVISNRWFYISLNGDFWESQMSFFFLLFSYSEHIFGNL